jgi:hypothetical protein
MSYGPRALTERLYLKEQGLDLRDSLFLHGFSLPINSLINFNQFVLKHTCLGVRVAVKLDSSNAPPLPYNPNL